MDVVENKQISGSRVSLFHLEPQAFNNASLDFNRFKQAKQSRRLISSIVSIIVLVLFALATSQLSSAPTPKPVLIMCLSGALVISQLFVLFYYLQAKNANMNWYRVYCAYWLNELLNQYTDIDNHLTFSVNTLKWIKDKKISDLSLNELSAYLFSVVIGVIIHDGALDDEALSKLMQAEDAQAIIDVLKQNDVVITYRSFNRQKLLESRFERLILS